MEQLFLYILYRSLLMTVVLFAIFALRFWFEKQLSPTARHGLWFFLFPVMLLPMSIVPISVPAENVPVSEVSSEPVFSAQKELPAPLFDRVPDTFPEKTEKHSVVQITAPVPVVAVGMESRTDISGQKEPFYRSVSQSFLTLSALVWGSGIVILPLLSLFQILHYRRRFAKAVPVTDANTLALLGRCRKDLNGRMHVQLLESRRLLFPVLVGMVQPRIILPTGFIEHYTEEQLSYFLYHELAHLKRRDILTGWLMSLLCMVHWFNPFVWAALRAMNADAEEAADQLATKAFDKTQRIEYGLTLLSLSEYLNEIPKQICSPISKYVPGAVGLMESSTQLSRRIEMLKQRETWHPGWILFAFIICLTVSTLTLVRVQFVEAETINSQQSSPEKKSVVLPEPREKIIVPGTVLLPDNIDQEKFNWKQLAIKYNLKHRLNPQKSGSGNTFVKEDGSFTITAAPESEGFIFIIDSKNEWTAEPAQFSVERNHSESKPVIRLEKGLLLEGTLLDQANDHPISCMRIWLNRIDDQTQSETNRGTSLMLIPLVTDENGRFICRVLPGLYQINVDAIYFSQPEERNIYSFDLKINGNSDTKPVLKIPTPFTGKVLQADSDEPAKNVRVNIQSMVSMNWLHIDTDKNGLFRQRNVPSNSMIEISDPKNKAGLVSWTGHEMQVDPPVEFRLKKWRGISGRLIDAENGNPMPEKEIYYVYESSLNSQQRQFFQNYVKTNKDGNFKISNLVPGLTYYFYYVPVPEGKGYSNGMLGPRVLLSSCEVTDATEEQSNVGDWAVDLSFLTTDPREEALRFFEQSIKDAHSMVKNGKKKAIMQITVFKQAYPSFEYIKKLQAEGKLDDFALIVMKVDDFPRRLNRQFLHFAEQKLLLQLRLDPDNKHTKGDSLPMSLAQLRGEADSPWNVPKDDPSNNEEWKFTPGMVNPKILDNFLNDYRERKIKNKNQSGSVVVPGQRSERTIDEQLREPFWFDEKEPISFEAVIKRIQDESDIDIYIDWYLLKEVGIEPNTQVRIRLPSQMPLRDVLNYLSMQLHLPWGVQGEKLMIPASRVSIQRTKNQYYVGYYYVGDLLRPSVPLSESGTDASEPMDFAPLIDYIKTMVAPESWDKNAEMKEYHPNRTLVVRQNEDAHRDIAELLHRLRSYKIE